MTQKRLVFVGNTAWSMLRFRKHVFQHFIAEGCEVIVYAPRDSAIIELEHLGCKTRGFFMSRKGLNPLSDLFTFLQLVVFYLVDKPDVVFHYTIKPNIWGSFAAGLTRTRSVAITTGLGYVFVKNTGVNPMSTDTLARH